MSERDELRETMCHLTHAVIDLRVEVARVAGLLQGQCKADDDQKVRQLTNVLARSTDSLEATVKKLKQPKSI